LTIFILGVIKTIDEPSKNKNSSKNYRKENNIN